MINEAMVEAAVARGFEETYARRFLSYLAVVGECWEWRRRINHTGYGQVDHRSCTTTTHRMSHRMFIGAVPGGLYVLHHCDNKPCCNPAHLYAGTPAQNMKDRGDRGRTARGDRSGLRLHPERAAGGVRNGRAKLTPEQVVRIRERRAAGETPKSLAEAYGIAATAIGLIARGKLWPRVGGPRTKPRSKSEAARENLIAANSARLWWRHGA